MQTGIGGIPEAVLTCLHDKRNLGIHTEMCSDGVIELMESGVINGEQKSLHRGKAVAAFVAAGSYTKDGKVLIAHNKWTNYTEGARCTMIVDILPASGHRILMDGFPGFIHSGDDFGVNSAGIAITETTISHFSGYDPKGIPEFVRALKAMQYSASIDDYVRLMQEGTDGG